MKNGRVVLLLTLGMLCSGAALAHEAKPAAGGFTLQSGVIAQLDDAEKKLVQLAEAMPAEKFNWRPAEGVRSFAEVMLHTTAGNYFFATMLGSKLPEGIDPMNIEKGSTDKAKVVEGLKSSFAFARAAIKTVTAEQFNDAVKFFGQDSNKGNVIMLYATHAHEHLGQAIAYARTAGIVPPWSAKS